MMFEPLRKYAEFEGRARRSEYWLFTLFQALVLFGLLFLMLVTGAMSGGDETRVSVTAVVFVSAFGLFGLAMFIPSLAVSIRRLHDSDKSGWWLLLGFVPFGSLVVFIFTVLDGTPGPNRFGPDPKGRDGVGGGPTVVHHHHYAPGATPPAGASETV